MYPLLAERISVSCSLIIWFSFILSSTAHLSICARPMTYLYSTIIRLVQTDKTVVVENSINQDHTIKLLYIKILFVKTGNTHTISYRLFFLLTRPTSKEQAEGSETSARTIQTQG